MQINKRVFTPSTWVGLAIPLIGLPVWNLIAGSFLRPVMERNNITFLSTLITVGMALGVVAVVLWWEKKPLSALGIHRQTPRSIIFALSASIIIAIAGTLISLGLIKALNIPMPELVTEKIKAFPVWLALWIVLSSSIAEEFLYRGFVLERIGQVCGNIWIGGLITLVWFTAMHLPLGWLYTLTIVLPTSILITILYIWRRDLIANIMVHLVFNAPIAAAAILFALF